MYGENFFWEKQGSVSDTEPEGRVEKVETLPKELIPYRDTMRRWVESHIDDVNTFLQFGRTKFKIVYGDGFYHQPGTDTISLDVPHFKKYMDQGLGIEQAVFMPLFHEFAHLKTMAELGLAGKKNLCEHFNYEKGKEIQSKDDPTEFAQLHGTYRQFYNILEDTIVNFLVFETRHFGGVKGTREGRARGAIEQLYTDDFFPVYKNVGFGNGEYTFDQTSQSMVCVGEGNGDVEIMRKEDYENGFDWTKTESGSSKASQFLTFFMKHHMIGVKKEEIFTPENLEGSHVLDEDVAIALSQPLERRIKHCYTKCLKNMPMIQKN